VLPANREFDVDADPTHVITCGLRRSEKIVCAVAMGCHILSGEYIEACDRENTFVDEDKHPAEYRAEASSTIWPGAAARWRKQWHSQNKGPFTGLRVLINGETKPQLKVLSRMIRAGGGTVALSKTEGLTVDLAVLGAASKDTKVTLETVNSTWRSWVKRHSVKVVTGSYFVEVITSEHAPRIDDFLVKKT